MEEIEIAVNPAGKEELLAISIERAAAYFGLQFRLRVPSVPIQILSIGTCTSRVSKEP